MKQLLLSLLTLLLLCGHLNGSNSHRTDSNRTLRTLTIGHIRVGYEVPAWSVNRTDVDGVHFQFINIPGYGNLQEPGEPALPVMTELVAVPYNASTTLRVSSENYTDHSGYMVHPALQPATDHIGDPEPDFERNLDVYNANTFYPSELIEVTDTLWIRGMAVLVIQVRPVQFNPITGVLRVHQRITMDIGFQGGKITFEPFGSQNSKEYVSWVSGMVMNGALLPEGSGSQTSQTSPDYLILTIDPFKAAADSIALWRQQMGFRTEVISQPSWTYQQARMAVHQRYHSYIPRPDYLLILGDHNHVPAELIPVDNAHFGTDLYMVCMDGSTDHFPDMRKGRISVANATQALSVVQKIIKYEKDPVNDSLFYQRALHCAQFQDDDTSGYATRRFSHTSEEIRDYVMNQGYDIDRVYHTYAHVTPTNYNNTIYSNGEPLPAVLLRANGFQWNGDQYMIAQAINEGRFYVLHRDHGGVSGWGHPTFNTTSLNMLSNGNLQPVVFSLNCQTGNFLHNECFSEKFLRLPNAGAVGVFSASYISYSGYNDAIAVGAFDALWSNPGLVPHFGTGGKANPALTAQPLEPTMGQVLDHMMLRMMQTWNGSTTANRRQYRMFHYFGDPAMRMWTTYPQTITAQVADSVVLNTAHLSVTGCYPDGARVTLLYRDTLRASGLVVNGEVKLQFAPLYDTAFPAVVSITAHNFKPLIKQVVVTSAAQIQHNTPCQSVLLTVKKYCDPIHSGFTGADASAVAAPPCAILSGADVWFSFVAPPSGNVEVEIGEGIQQTGVAVYAGDCITSLHLNCNATINAQGRVILSVPGLTPGDTLLIRVWQNGLSSSEVFTICVREPDTFPVADLPYYTGFENGIDPYWELVSDHTNGRIRIDTICDARFGNASLLMDVSASGTFVQNEARLRLNMRNKENVRLSFWWREYGDENDEEDGVFFSDDGGENYVKVIELQGSFEGWTQYLVDVDRLAGLNGLQLTESFVIKFQQYDNWVYYCNTPLSGDGFAFDDIYVYEDTTLGVTAQVPYFTGFETGFDPCWKLSSTHPLGRLVATSAYGPSYDDDYFLLMDVSLSNNYNQNNADLHIDISSLQNLILRFQWRSFLNESHPENGVYLSDDGGETFVQVFSLLDSNRYWSEKNLNMEVIAQAHQLTPGVNTIVRFVQYDNWPAISDGFGFDNIELHYTQEPIIDLYPIAMSMAADSGSAIPGIFHIINRGTQSLRIDSVSAPPNFSVTFTGPQLIAPGDTLISPIGFHPQQVVAYEGQVYVFHNASRGLDSMRVAGEGMYRELVADLNTIVFDTLAWYDRDTIEFNVTNIGTGAIATTAVTGPTGFKVLTPQAQNFAAGQTRPVRVSFQPPLPGLYQGQITIASNANQVVIPISGYAANPLSISEETITSPFVVKPNPFNKYLHITFLEASTWSLVLLDMTGRIIYQGQTTGDLMIDMEDYAAGIYLLELIPEDDDQLFRLKVVKQ